MKKAVLLRSCAALFVPFAAVTFVATPAIAQETTSSISGTVTAAGVPVPNATVTIIHVPSGTRTVARTNAAGAYTAAGVRNGGPYTVTASARGFANAQVTDVYTTLGQTFELPLTLEAAGREIVVTASRVRGARSISSGPATILTANDISKIASVNRDIRDLMQRDPFASLDASQSTGRQVTFAGTNPRFNRFTVDGVPITDSFGLNPDALPSRRGPVPLDAIGQFETKVAPYDIREGFFEGGVINAVLKSGTNQFHGSAFYTYNDNTLNGHENTGQFLLTVPNLKTKSQDYGAEIAGPIIKDRVFFMIAGERVRATLPITYTYTATIPEAALNQVISIAQSVYSVTAGSPIQINSDSDDRVVGKIDANISDSQRLSLTGIYTKDSIIAINRNFNNSVSTMSDDYVKPNRVFGGVAQLNSDWSSVVSTEARLRYKDYKSGQDPFTPATALAVVCTDPTQALFSAPVAGASTATSCPNNAGTVFVGPPGSAAANKLRVKTFGASLLTRFNFGDHTVRLLSEYENSDNYDLFLAGSGGPTVSPGPYGAYYFDTIFAFQNRTAQAFGYTNSTTGVQNDAAAAFTYKTGTFGIQDDWRVNSQLHVTAGLRYDRYGSGDLPIFNANFVRREGFANNSFIDGKSLLQPRVGFDYLPTPRLSFHGGVGIFGGGTPDVYVANSFSATGVQPASVSDSQVPSALNNVSLTTVPAAAQTAVGNALLSANGTVSALHPNFKIPSQWRATLSGNYRANLGPLGDNWSVGGDVLFNRVRNAILVQDFRDRPITGASALTPDGRQRYYDVVSTISPTANCVVNTTQCFNDPGDYVLTNTKKGRGFVGVVHANKQWDFGLNAGVSFTYQNIKDQQALTSSIAGSNYNNGAYLDPNGGAYGHSNDEVRYSVKYNLSFEHAFFGDYKTRIDMFGQTRSGYPFSYTFFDPQGAARGAITPGAGSVFGTTGTASHYLFYVPTGPSDPKVTYIASGSGTTFQSAAQNQAIVEALISSSGLSKYRGMIAPRNAFNDPWFTKIDLHLEQQIPTFVRQARISVYGDIENVLNLLNHSWGETLRTTFPGNKSVVNVTCATVGANTCDHYVYSAAATPANLASTAANSNLGASLYTIRFGARLTF
ncbi:carboxypeptidase regulatory-like domain-containing protein [Sphingomonas sp.]|uniref:TonB-dependent receptor n=1 Tax=Sphingomonas sp. TaxID=28214 RepID=UPI0038AA31D4